MSGVKLPTLSCKQCGYTWVPRIPNTRMCAKCKSTYWNEDKKTRHKKVAK